MKKKNTIITIILGIILIIMILFTATGCNKQIFDFKYTYDYAICDLKGLPERIDIYKWSDYEGEQIQIVSTDGNTYLVNSMYCALVQD